MTPPFSYIITIHNKEKLLARVLAGVAQCCGPQSCIVPVLDGCTDGSEAIARRFADESGLDVRLVFAPDVHEIKSLNLGLHAANPEGYAVLVQDDVILQTPDLEERVHALCNEHDRKLGYLSFRMGADVRPKMWFRRLRLAWRLKTWDAFAPQLEDYNWIGGPGEASRIAVSETYQFHARRVGIKSPVCLTPELRACDGFLDEAFAPYCYDDFDQSLRAEKQGLVNGLFPIPFQSDEDWGGTRQDPEFAAASGARVMLRNRRLLWQKHGAWVSAHDRSAAPSRERPGVAVTAGD